MKLLSLSYNNPYNKLKTYNFDFANGRSLERKLEPLCFVGLNGSGKSKLIEIIAEIFFVLDANRSTSWRAKADKNCESNFELCYQLHPSRKYQVVKIIGKVGKPPVVTANEDEEPLSIAELEEVLPANIVGYSSGHNETISPRFLELRRNDLSTSLKGIIEGSGKDTDQTRTLFLDRDTTTLLLLTAYIFSGEKGRDNYPTMKSSRALLVRFKEFLNLESILSFRLIVDTQKDKIKLSRRMENTIEKLQHCSLLLDEEISGKGRRIVFDFIVNDISKAAFKNLFESPQSFFEELYELNSLNLIDKGARSEHKVFVVPESDLKVRLNSPVAEATYRSLSDGEHQFIQIFAAAVYFSRDDSLFLFDEPESHFNPAWRAKFVYLLDELLGAKQKSSEFLISTHSPYLVSACDKSNVIKFVRDAEGISFDRLEDQTFGASFDVLLKALFDMKGLVAEVAKNELQKVVQGKGTNEDKVQKLKEDFGDSYEKRLLINMLEKGLLDAVSD